jgi:Na+-driven multidrug efflux pump
VLGRLLSGSFWLVLRLPVQIITSFWSTRLILETIGPVQNDAYLFAWGFSFFQFLFEFGASSALQRQMSDVWTRDDRDGVNRTIACGMCFYTAMAVLQIAALLGVAYWALPYSKLSPSSFPFVVKLLWLQALTSPCFGFSVVVSSVLQAARRYDFVPRFEVMIVVMRFVVLVAGVRAGFDFFWVVAAQTITQIALGLCPALWVMMRELGYVPHFHGARWSDYKALGHISVYVALIQISVVLADRVDTAVLGFMMPDHTEGAITVYGLVSKAFLNVRQTGWMLAYMVMPAVASLAAAQDNHGLNRVKYDGTRMHIAAISLVGLLAFLYAGPFLAIWIRARDWDAMHALGYGLADVTWLMRLFLVATLPLVLSVPVQMSIGINKIKVIALAALAGSVINLPISCVLTARLGVAGVIWGTVLTTLFSNLIVPGVYVFRVLEIDPRTFMRRTLSAPLTAASALLLVALSLQYFFPLSLDGTNLWARAVALVVQLAVASMAFVGGYLLTPMGRRDLSEIFGKLRGRPAVVS